MTLQEIQNIPADEKGMISLLLNGVERRFMKDKFISYLQRNNSTSCFTVPKVKTQKPKKEQRPKRIKKIKEVKPGRGLCNSVPIVAILPDGTEREFPSSAKASRELKIYKSGVCRVLNGKLPHVNLIKFKFQTAG